MYFFTHASKKVVWTVKMFKIKHKIEPVYDLSTDRVANSLKEAL